MSVNKKTIQLYWQQARKSKHSFFTMLLAIPLGALIIDTLLPYVLAQAIDAMSTNNTRQLIETLSVATGVGLIGAALNLIGFQAMIKHESKTIAHLRQDTFEKLIHKDNSFFSNQKIGAMTSRYIDFVRSEVTLQDLLIIRTLGFVLSVGGGIILLAFESILIAGLILGLIIILILQVRWSIKYRKPLRHERKTLVSSIHGQVADALTNSLIVRTFASENRESDNLKKLTDRFSEVYRKDLGFFTAEGSVRVAIMVFVQVLSIAIVAYFVTNNQMSLAIAVFILAYMQRIGSQLFILTDIIAGFDQALLDAQPMTEMLEVDDIVIDKQNAIDLKVKSASIKFSAARYRYSDGVSDVLEAIDLEIPAGQKVGMVGHSGAGKSTIVQLLLRFNDVTGGSISIDGKDLRDVTQSSLRRNIAYVPQEPMLFHRSLKENIAYGKPNATEDEIIEATKQANAWEFIKTLPDGLDTTVGERGIKLSGGQRQRIAIARALLKDAPILVLDEATSALDSQSENLIQQSLARLMKGRTSIVVAHRLSTIAKLDRIVVLDGGKIVEDGSHQELINQSGIYASLWSHQSGGFIEE